MNIQTNFEAQMQKLTQRIKFRLTLGGNAVKIVKRQFGLLMRTLIDISPPKNRDKSVQRIDNSVNTRFKPMPDVRGDPEKAGHRTVTWTGSSRFALYGFDKSSDMRSASVSELQKLYYEYSQGSGKGVQAARDKYSRGHGKQTVYVWTRAFKKATVNALRRLFVSHLGRLKAGWIRGWKACGSPGRSIAEWIGRHEGSVNSDVIMEVPESSDKIGNLSITAINRQAGGEALKQSGLLESAARIRADRLAGDIKFAIEHPDKWHEREAQIDEELVS